MTAVLFGSISTVADTSELQRQAFNEAFEAHGLGWEWDRDTYVDLLDAAGGQNRIAAFAESQGQDVDAQAVHATKSKNFQDLLVGAQLSPRAGVAESIRAAKDQGLKVGLVTTTSQANVTALLAALHPSIDAADFDVIVDSSSVEQPKPDAAAYAFAMDRLGQSAEECVAIEDNVDGVRSATAAGVACVAFPNANTAGHDFGAADRVDSIDLAGLQKHLGTPA